MYGDVEFNLLSYGLPGALAGVFWWWWVFVRFFGFCFLWFVLVFVGGARGVCGYSGCVVGLVFSLFSSYWAWKSPVYVSSVSWC